MLHEGITVGIIGVVGLVGGLGLTACGGDDSSASCLPQGRVSLGAAGTVGAPLAEHADCYAGATPVVSLGQARAAVVTGDSIVFDDVGLTASIDSETCRVSITYGFESTLTDGTAADGNSSFAASPDPDEELSWSSDSLGSTRFEWLDPIMGNKVVCGNVVTGVAIAVEPSISQ